MQPEPNAGPESAIASLAASDPKVPLALLVGATPTLVFYSDRPTITMLQTPQQVKGLRSLWLIAEISYLPSLRESAPQLVVLARRQNLVLVALPGAPTLAPAQ